ncbi:head-tail connector protein [Micromonospora sp. NPDC048063]|uniref:head-tail connector protein n=1 Tax=Micromonospora sp. NPDC048063 TaxID=3364256 RepID=UPI0037249899
MPIPAGGTNLAPTLDDLKKQLNRTDTRDDAELQLYLDAAIEVVENILGGPLEVKTFTEQHVAAPRGTISAFRRELVIIPDRRPVVSVTSLAHGGSAIDPGSYNLDMGAGTVTVGYASEGDYTLVYEAGYASLPPSYKLATLIIAQHLWRTQHGSGGRVPPGSEDVVTVPGASFAIPSRARELLASGILPVIA